MTTGYRHPNYAQAFTEFGAPQELPLSQGWILRRQIPDFPDHDAIGCYPLFSCQDWSQLETDLREVGDDLICLSLVADPFGEYEVADLKRCFGDVVTPFKKHFIIDLNRSINSYVSDHHRRNARKALRTVTVERCGAPLSFLDEWVKLYRVLVERHKIRGLTAFSRESFAKQLQVPGIIAFQAIHEGKVVGMLLWYAQGNIGYYHLGAYSLLGYKLRASFALFWSVIDYFAANGLKWLNLGAGAGTMSDSTDGLSRFKRGWATDIRPAYFCGRIFNRTRYEEIVRMTGADLTDYFPAYRQGEFE